MLGSELSEEMQLAIELWQESGLSQTTWCRRFPGCVSGVGWPSLESHLDRPNRVPTLPSYRFRLSPNPSFGSIVSDVCYQVHYPSGANGFDPFLPPRLKING